MKKIILPVVCILFFASCKKDNSNKSTSQAKIAPDGFNYATAKMVSVNLSFKAPNNDALSGILVRFYNPADTTTRASAIYTAVTDKNGDLKASISVPSSLNNLLIDPQSFGIMRYANAKINGTTITAILGGTGGYSGDITAPVANGINSLQHNLSVSGRNGSGSALDVSGSTTFEYPSPYTDANAILNTAQYPASAGRPVYLNKPTTLDALTLSYLNSTLPEGVNLYKAHPEFFASSAPNTINITKTGPVTITFATGITSCGNSLAYYTYPTSTPPKSLSDIKNATYLFPNASNRYDNPLYLQPGDNFTLGTFTAGTSIGFILINYGWLNYNGAVAPNNPKWYSQDALNSDGIRHSIVAYDNVHNSFYIGFEDTNKNNVYCDYDYNDCVFFATGPGISNTGVPPIVKGVDTDGDGVPDAIDAFPNDPTRAYINYFPSQDSYAQLAFEDNWPVKGDYDLNDVVVNYRYTLVSNAQNQIVTMQGDYSVAAAGTVFKDGFGVQLPVAASAVKAVTGQQQISNYIKFAANGVEASQSKAVIIPFDNYNALLTSPYGSLINTISSQAKYTSTTASVLVTFTSPVDPAILTPSGLNPFIIVKLQRGAEVHLPGYLPTDLANKALLGTGDDATNLATGKTYVSSLNWPWALSFNSPFSYPVEDVNISLAYPHFLDWAQAAGASFTDWYSNTAAGYRNTSYIYAQ
jgi:LruC domain-containing protein